MVKISFDSGGVAAQVEPSGQGVRADTWPAIPAAGAARGITLGNRLQINIALTNGRLIRWPMRMLRQKGPIQGNVVELRPVCSAYRA